MAKFFEGSLNELEQRNPWVEGSFRRIDANCLTATVYLDGKSVNNCKISWGGLKVTPKTKGPRSVLQALH
jgi:hypothetical protein